VAKGIKYVQLEAAKFLTDRAYQRMSLAERGLYTYLIFVLYDEEGSLEFDPAELADLCRASEDEFNQAWEGISKKFILKGKKLSHKKVTEQIKKATKRRKDAEAAAVKSWEKRRNGDESAMRGQCEGNATAMRPQCEGNANISEVKGSKGKGREGKGGEGKKLPRDDFYAALFQAYEDMFAHIPGQRDKDRLKVLAEEKFTPIELRQAQDDLPDKFKFAPRVVLDRACENRRGETIKTKKKVNPFAPDFENPLSEKILREGKQ